MTSTVRNKTWAELQVGDCASINRSCVVQDLILFAHVSGNTNPLMLPDPARPKPSTNVVAPSMWMSGPPFSCTQRVTSVPVFLSYFATVVLSTA